MPDRLSLSRAARLVGVSRGTLQKKIRLGELESFDGTVSADDLVQVFPTISLDDNTVLERFQSIKDNAYAGRIRERILPPAEVLAARLSDLSRELAGSRSLLTQYQGVVTRLERTLDDLLAETKGDAHSGLMRLRHWFRDELEREVLDIEPVNPILIKDSILRIMAAHVEVRPSKHEFFVEGTDSILEAALKNGLAMGYGCASGNCGLCAARLVSGEVRKLRPHDYAFTEAERLKGMFLMCSNGPVTDIVIEAREAGSVKEIPLQTVAARVKHTEHLSDDIVLLHLQTPRSNRLRFLAGQSATLDAGKGLQAEFPIASCPCDDRNIEFHVRKDVSNDFSAFVFHRVKPSDLITITGPSGEFVFDDESPRPAVFVAVEHGFAPIKSLVEHAMALESVESLHLYWIGRNDGDRYLHNLCRSWADALDNFHYTPVNLPGGEGARTAAPEAVRACLRRIADEMPGIAECDVYVAAPAAVLPAMQTFFAGAGLPAAQYHSMKIAG